MTSVNGLLSAESRDLVIVSYEIDPLLVLPYMPAGVSLDFHHGHALVTLVGYRILDVRAAGVQVPLPPARAKIDLRFYVWRREAGEVRRGVVFIKEIVPERHDIVDRERGWASYEWLKAGRWNRIAAAPRGRAEIPPLQSIGAFVADRPWGYTRQPDGSTEEYRVEHPPWAICPAESVLDCDVGACFGREFVSTFARPPLAEFVAAGAKATYYPGRLID